MMKQNLLIPGVPIYCCQCSAPLCLRKQVLNLALGETEKFLCLVCLADAHGQKPEELLQQMRDYVLSRDCFKKQWQYYLSVEYCPDPSGCLPEHCFAIQ